MGVGAFVPISITGLTSPSSSCRRCASGAMLRRHRGNASAASEALGLPKKTFYDKLHRLNVVAEDFR